MREARDEAKKEIEAYRASKEAEYKAFEAEVLGILQRGQRRDTDSRQHTHGNKQAEEEASKEADVEIAKIQEAGKKSQDKVVNDLLAAVFEAHPAPVA